MSIFYYLIKFEIVTFLINGILLLLFPFLKKGIFQIVIITMVFSLHQCIIKDSIKKLLLKKFRNMLFLIELLDLNSLVLEIKNNILIYLFPFIIFAKKKI